MSFINQAVNSAIVPMIVAYQPMYRRRDEYGMDGAWVEFTSEQKEHARNWTLIHGAYTFKDHAREGSEDPLTVVEARMMLSTYLHDFCGGTMIASGNAYIAGEMSYWSYRPMLGDRGMMKYQINSDNKKRLPCINDALRAERTITQEEARAIMRRSLMAAALSWTFTTGKRGVIGFDRATHRTALRDVMRTAKELTWIPSNYPTYPRFDPQLVQNTASNIALQMLKVGDFAPIGVTVDINEDVTYINRNSGSRVGPIMLTYLADEEYDPGEGDLPDEEEEEEYRDEEYDEDGNHIVRNRSEYKSYPRWFTFAADRAVFASTFPLTTFNNG